MWRVVTSRRTVVAWRQGATPVGYPTVAPNGIASSNRFGTATVTATYPPSTTGRHRNWLVLTRQPTRVQVGRNGWIQTKGFSTILPTGLPSGTTFGAASVNPPLTNDQMRDLYMRVQALQALLQGVNVARVNGVTIKGTGVAGVDPWGPA